MVFQMVYSKTLFLIPDSRKVSETYSVADRKFTDQINKMLVKFCKQKGIKYLFVSYGAGVLFPEDTVGEYNYDTKLGENEFLWSACVVTVIEKCVKDWGINRIYSFSSHSEFNMLEDYMRNNVPCKLLTPVKSQLTIQHRKMFVKSFINYHKMLDGDFK